jgi:predicted nuclease with TOPRIM domain
MSAESDEILQAMAAYEVAMHKRSADLEASLVKRFEELRSDFGHLRKAVAAGTNDAARLHEVFRQQQEAIRKMKRDFDDCIEELKDRSSSLASAQDTLQRSLDVLDTRVQRLRDSVIPLAPAGAID